MRLQGNEHIEIAHDVLAAKVYEKASPLERQRLDAERLVRESYRQYRDRGKLLDRSDLRLIRPVEDRLQLEAKEWAYLRHCRRQQRARRALMIAGAIMVVLLLGFLWDANRRETVQRRLAMANRWVYLANHFSSVNQLDSALLYAGAAYEQSRPEPLPAAQRLLAEAFHKGLEGIPLRQEQHPLSGHFEGYVLLKSAQKMLITYDDGRLALFDLKEGTESTLYTGTFLDKLVLHPGGGQALVADEDTILRFDLRTGELADRFQKAGILLGQGFWPAAGGTLSITEDSLYFRSQGDRQADWKRSLPSGSTFITDYALAPDASYVALMGANDTIYRFDTEGSLLEAIPSPAPLLALVILDRQNLFLLGEENAWLFDTTGSMSGEYPLPPVAVGMYGPQLAQVDPDGTEAVYLNMGHTLLRLTSSGNPLDTVSTYDTLYTRLQYAPERKAAIDLRTQHLISLESGRARRLMTLPAFTGMDYEDQTGSLVMMLDTTLTWWQFTFGPYQERQAVESMFVPRGPASPLLAVEDGVVYRKKEDGTDGWEVVQFPEPIAEAVVRGPDQAILGLSLDGSLYRLTGTVAQQIFQVEPSGQWEPFLFQDSILALRERSGDRVYIWDPGKQAFETHDYNGILHDIDYNSGTDLLAIAGSNDDVLLLHEAKDTVIQLLGHGRDVLDVDFSPDGRFIATASGDGSARLWNLKGELLHVFPGHRGFVNAVQFAPDGNMLLTASDDFTFKSWDLRTGHLLYNFFGHEGPVLGVSFSPDGRSVLSWSTDGTARLWDLQGEPLGVFGYPERQDPIDRAEFTAEGSRIITHSQADRMRIWLIPSEVVRWLELNYELEVFTKQVAE